MSSARERPFFFASQGNSLYGVLHEGAPGASDAFVFSHPFGEEKLWSGRVLVQFARTLARRGLPVLRFDYAGCGDSGGDLAQSSISTAVRDLHTAIETAKAVTGCRSVSLLGLRLGASIAVRAADERDDVRRLVLWAPIVNGTRYVQDLLRINLATQMAVFREIRHDRASLVAAMREGRPVNVDGYPLGPALHDELLALQLAAGPRAFGGPALVAQIERGEAPARSAELASLAGTFRAGSLIVVREEPFWKEIDLLYEEARNLFDATLAWMEAP